MHHDVERLVAKILNEPRRHAADRAIADVLVPFARSDVFGDRVVRVVDGVERVNLLEAQQRPRGQRARLVHLAALEQIQKNVESGRPRSDADAGSGLGQRLGDREPEAGVVRNPGHEGPPPCEIDLEHAI